MKRIVALIDFSDKTTGVIHFARDAARAFNCALLLLHVIESKSDFVDDEIQEDLSPHVHAMRSRRREMEILDLELHKEGVNASTHVAQSPRDRVDATILEEVARHSPDLIVMGASGHGHLYQLLCGSASDTVVRKSHCPVVLVPRGNGKKVSAG
jgi:nucleotide-binding universal stress UspA family protein